MNTTNQTTHTWEIPGRYPISVPGTVNLDEHHRLSINGVHFPVTEPRIARALSDALNQATTIMEETP